MESVKRYRADHRHVVETEFDDAQFVGVADYDAAIMRIGNMVCSNRQMSEELEIARDDLLIFKSGLSALGEASKKLIVCARTSGGTAGPDQGLMDACAGVESVITLAGVARAMDDFERIQAENLALQQRLTTADQRIDELETHLTSLEQRCHAEQQACMAAERRVKELEGLMQGWLDLFPKQGVTGGPITIMKERTVSALNPTAEAVSHDQ